MIILHWYIFIFRTLHVFLLCFINFSQPSKKEEAKGGDDDDDFDLFDSDEEDEEVREIM